MKPIDFYQLEPVKILDGAEAINELRGFYYNHIPEITDDLGWLNGNKQIYVKIINRRYIDDRRYWQVAGVWFDDIPVMIIQNAGREGDDHARRFITNEDAYLDMVDYIRNLLNPNICDKVYSVEEDIKDLIEFYGYKLSL